VTSIVDHLGMDRFYVIGWSGGGPHALACAALMPDRVIAAATIAGVAPRDAEGLDWLAGMGEENIEEFGAAETGEQELRTYLEQHAAELTQATGPDLHAALGDLLSDVDKAALTGDFAEYLADASRHGLAHGIWGWFDDDVAFLKDWGFDVGATERPVTIWQGEQDRFVPFGHGRWLADHVSGARAELHPEHGHLSLAVASYDRILDSLLAAA
jgi:pimeloyl-ACP methyl ester carboxylesterase